MTNGATARRNNAQKRTTPIFLYRVKKKIPNLRRAGFFSPRAFRFSFFPAGDECVTGEFLGVFRPQAPSYGGGWEGERGHARAPPRRFFLGQRAGSACAAATGRTYATFRTTDIVTSVTLCRFAVAGQREKN